MTSTNELARSGAGALFATLAACSSKNDTSESAASKRPIVRDTGFVAPRDLGNGFIALATLQRRQAVVSVAPADETARLPAAEAQEVAHRAVAFDFAQSEICPRFVGGGAPKLREGGEPAFSSKGFWSYAVVCS